MTRPDATQVTVVTGAAGGVGRALISHYLAKGYTTIAIDEASLAELPREALSIQGDLSNPSFVASIPYKLKEHGVAHINLLVNACGEFLPDPGDQDIEQLVEVLMHLFRVNTASAVALSWLLVPLLRAASSSLIVNIASTDGIVASSGQNCAVGVSHDILYSVSKGALITLTRALAMKLASAHIRVNAICPTIVRSPMSESILDSPEAEAMLAGYIPLGRVCEPSDIVSAIVALESLHMTTGHVLTVDGGYLCL